MEWFKAQLKKCTRKLYRSMENGRARKIYRTVDFLARKAGGRFYDKTIKPLKVKIKYSVVFQDHMLGGESFSELCWRYEKRNKNPQEPLVSIIVPNYNHEPYLRERLESIYNQTYQNFEVILLDDKSTDNSQDILTEYAQKYSEKTVTFFNQRNGGCVFEQWNKGLSLARGSLIWIAESDDYCERNFLEKMVSLFSYDSVKIAFARSIFMQDGIRIWSTEEYLHDLNKFEWDKPFYMTAHNMVKYGFAIHNMIPNASSAVFRNTGVIPDEVMNICKNMKLSSDWIFYLYVMRGGVVGYTNETTNYYRIHKNSTSLKIQQKMDYYREFEEVSCFIAQNYNVEDKVFEQVLQNLMVHYKVTQNAVSGEVVKEYYHIDKIGEYKKKRRPNILMACYALKSGGGETYPIYLANELCKQGVAVTLIDFNIEEDDENIRSLVDNKISVVTIKSLDFLKHIIVQLGGEVIHSHHASVDEAVSQWLNHNEGLCKHVITLHGMYESIQAEDCERVISHTWKSCSKYIYIADKNLDCFLSRGYDVSEKFIKLPNGLPMIIPTPVDRKILNIPDTAFVLTIASRGIKEKGWQEGIDAVVQANRQCDTPIHLVIVGDGSIRTDLEQKAPDYIHFVGTQSNVRDYFAMSDAGLVPTYFKGESYPLVIIECLMTGTPVIATDIAEVKNQLTDSKGELAGILLPIHDWHINTDDICKAILEMVNNRHLYLQFKERTCDACKKFDISSITGKYLGIYLDALGGNGERATA